MTVLSMARLDRVRDCRDEQRLTPHDVTASGQDTEQVPTIPGQHDLAFPGQGEQVLLCARCEVAHKSACSP